LLSRHLGRAVPWSRALCFFFLITSVAQAQQQASRVPDRGDEIAFFYKDPRPQRLIEFFADVQSRALPWSAYPPLAGLFAGVFKLHPEQVDQLVPAVKDVKAAYTLIAASRLSGQPAKAEALRAKFTSLGSDERLNAEFAGLPNRIEDLQIATPTHLDILWGASFADGDGRYVMPIIDYLASTANTSELVAIDIAKTAVEMSGGPKGTIAGLRGKYGEARGRQMIYAATALWAIASNTRQHDYVKRTVTKYIGDHPGTPATKALSALTGIK
jgi:hypothetical protein